MSLIVEASSQAAAEAAARSLRLEGFLARAVCRGRSSLVIVTCLSHDRELVLARVKRADAGSRPIAAA
jgi:hypothetical protein